ncbi:MAG TPA: DUF1992 domain-containing protein [Thermomicrobiales bacterium]|nr:DUF1992 domain-containing protein [Thermomicrobiales bacterium]
MPLRREGDQIEEIESFDEWVHERLEEAIARGDFDNLPHKGKPIRIERNPFQPELDLAFSRLKNAGMAPAWIELDREIRRMQETLDRWLRASADRLAAEAARIRALEEVPVEAQPSPWQPWYRRWWPFRLFVVDPEGPGEDDLIVEWRRWDFERRRDREQYLERAKQLDAKIQLFNNSVPRNLWHLEKLRFLPAKASQRFDTAVPKR